MDGWETPSLYVNGTGERAEALGGILVIILFQVLAVFGRLCLFAHLFLKQL